MNSSATSAELPLSSNEEEQQPELCTSTRPESPMSIDSGQFNTQIDSPVIVPPTETSDRSFGASPIMSDRFSPQTGPYPNASIEASSSPPLCRSPVLPPDRSHNHCENLFIRPKENERRSFFEQHPIQIEGKPFYCTKDGLPRKWLTFCETEESFYCSVCLVFGNEMSNFASSGERDKRHWACRVQEHEKSKAHLQAVSDYISWNHNSVEESFARQLTISKTEIQRKRDFLSRVIDIIKLIGKLGLPYRGAKEAAHTLDNQLVNHGVLLELILLLTRYDQVTADHVETCVKKSQDAYDKWKKKGRKGRLGRGTDISKILIKILIQNKTKFCNFY